MFTFTICIYYNIWRNFASHRAKFADHLLPARADTETSRINSNPPTGIGILLENSSGNEFNNIIIEGSESPIKIIGGSDNTFSSTTIRKNK